MLTLLSSPMLTLPMSEPSTVCNHVMAWHYFLGEGLKFFIRVQSLVGLKVLVGARATPRAGYAPDCHSSKHLKQQNHIGP